MATGEWWSGSGWIIPREVWVWDGAAWIEALEVYLWDGSAWVLIFSQGEWKTWAEALTASKTTSILDFDSYLRAKTAPLSEAWALTKQQRNQTKGWSESLAASKATNHFDFEEFLRAKTAQLSEAWSRTKQARNKTKGWSEALAASKVTSHADVEEFIRSKTALLSESWTRTKQGRNKSKVWSESLAASKSTSHTDTVPTPTNFSANRVSSNRIDLSWSNDGYSEPLDAERRDDALSAWETVFTGLTAGSTSYEDNGANANTGEYRIRFSGFSEWEHTFVLE